jgi:transcriptional regulator with XRE-family HTH domain
MEKVMAHADFIQTLRKEAGLTQESVAQKIGVGRTTYLAIEAGKRELGISEVQKLAELYQLAPGDIIDEKAPVLSDTSPAPLPELSKHALSAGIEARDINPKTEPQKVRDVLLYVLSKIGARPNVGETVLYKLLYFIDFDFYELHGRSITGLTYIRNHYGPTPAQRFKDIVDKMVETRELELVETACFSHTQKKYLPTVEADLTSLSAQEIKHIDEVLERLGDKNASELSLLSHRDVPWITAEPNKRIDYQMVMYRTDATSQRELEDEL